MSVRGDKSNDIIQSYYGCFGPEGPIADDRNDIAGFNDGNDLPETTPPTRNTFASALNRLQGPFSDRAFQNRTGLSNCNYK